ncbi:MAG: hypothetical protein IKV48_03645 [Eggerthellaceae bacterium]|nr:hypothetical protein [Eggerthellaceae bacterium]
MKKKENRLARAAHIKKNTHGTSNELSFSVLDAAKQSLDENKGKSSSGKPSALGIIPIFTFAFRKKPPATPTKEQGLMLSSGEFVSTEGTATPSLIAGSVTSTTGAASGVTSVAEASSSAATTQVSSASPLGGASSAGEKSYSTDWMAPREEVARKKAARMRRKASLAVLLTVVCLVAVGLVGTTVYKSIKLQQDIRGQLVSQIKVIEKADEAVLALDELIVACINDGWENTSADFDDDYHELMADLEESKAALASVIEGAAALYDSLDDPYDQEAAVQAQVAAEARLSMIDSGIVVLEQMRSSGNALEHAENAWINLLGADTLLREAAELASNTSKETVTASMEKTNEALGLLATSASHFKSAESELSEVDFSKYLEYVDLRTQSANHALLSDQAYLDRNKEKAAAENDKYNELDAQAAALAKEIGSDPVSMVVATVDPIIDAELERYLDDRARASTSDESLRAYLANKG